MAKHKSSRQQALIGINGRTGALGGERPGSKVNKATPLEMIEKSR
jgi:hypothetical protein